MKKFCKKVMDILVLLFTGKDRDAVNSGICDYSGQGKDKYGN